MTDTRKLWIALITLLVLSFGVLLFIGREIGMQAPPVPDRVVTRTGQIVYTRADIERGRQVWQSIGGMQLGSVWGHGGYVAPDWTADWLHRELEAILNGWAERDFGAPGYAALTPERQATLQARLRPLFRTNSYDPATRTITIDPDRAQAIAIVSRHYESLFGDDPRTAELRENYAMKNGTVASAGHRRALGAFFWWTAWAASTERPQGALTYTNN